MEMSLERGYLEEEAYRGRSQLMKINVKNDAKSLAHPELLKNWTY